MTKIIDDPESAQFYVVTDGSNVVEGVCSPGDVVASALTATVSATENEHLAALAAYSDQFPPLPDAGEWTDSGVTVVALLGAGVIRVTDTAPFSADTQIRIDGNEATVTSIHTSGANGIIVIAPHIAVSGGEIIEIWQ